MSLTIKIIAQVLKCLIKSLIKILIKNCDEKRKPWKICFRFLFIKYKLFQIWKQKGENVRWKIERVERKREVKDREDECVSWIHTDTRLQHLTSISWIQDRHKTTRLWNKVHFKQTVIDNVLINCDCEVAVYTLVLLAETFQRYWLPISEHHSRQMKLVPAPRPPSQIMLR